MKYGAMINTVMKNNNDAVKNKLTLFFQQFTSKQINELTSVNNDLRLMVSEVPLIHTLLEKELHVDIEMKDLEMYFLEEFSIPFQYTYYKIFKPWKLVKSPLTIKHLVEVCEKGFWFPPSESKK